MSVELKKDTIISHYKILGKLGEGGMGVVYKAQDTKLDRLVALKFLPKQFSINQEEKNRFIHEAKAAAALDHPNICSVYEIDETDDGQMFIAMAYYRGGTLKDKIASGPLPIADCINIAIQIAEGLNKAHKQDVIHRDIKSANIIVTEDGIAKIVDFGLAKLKGLTKLTKEGTTLGTVAYMSPEQATGEDADHRSDIWSLGVLFYEMVTGQLPFKGDYDQAIMYSIMNEDPKPVTGLRTGIPLELERIINKALVKNPDERYQGATDLLVDLKKLKKDTDPELSITKKEEVPAPPLKLYRRFLIGACLVILAILAAVLIILKPFSKEEVLPQDKIGIAVVHFENRTSDKTLDHLKLVIPDLLITSLEQSKYFSVLTWERMGDLLKQMGKDKKEFIDKELGFEICRREGIKNLVVGSFTRLGNTYATDVKIMNPETKELLKGASSKGKGEQSIIDNQIDELSRQISKASGLSELRIKETIKPVREVTTKSMEAYNYFIRGRKEREIFSVKEAMTFLKKAVEFDTTFATAHNELALLYQYIGNFSASEKANKKAMEFSTNATKKERLWIEAVNVGLKRDYKGWCHYLEKISQEYPKDKRAHYWLAGSYKTQNLYEKAISSLKRALELDPNSMYAINSLTNLYARLGRFEEAIELNKEATAKAPGEPLPVDTAGYVYFLMGRLDDSIKKYKETSEIRAYWGNINLAYIYALKEDYTESMRWIDKEFNINTTSARSQVRAGRAIFRKAFYNYWLGRYQQSLNDLNRVTDLDLGTGVDDKPLKAVADLLRGWIHYDTGELEQMRIYCKRWYDVYLNIPVMDLIIYQKTEMTAIYRFLQAFIELKAGRVDKVKSKLKDMLAQVPEIRPGFFYLGELINNWNHLIKAEVFLKEGQPGMAIANSSKFSPAVFPAFYFTFWVQIHNMPFLHDTLARAYVKNKELDKAIIEYERLTTFDPTSKDRRLIHPRYHYRLGKLYQQNGLKDKAIKSLNKFITLWKDCDPIFQPLIKDAKKRVEELEK